MFQIYILRKNSYIYITIIHFLRKRKKDDITNFTVFWHYILVFGILTAYAQVRTNTVILTKNCGKMVVASSFHYSSEISPGIQ